MAALFFSEMRYDPRDPKNPDNDRFVLSKGHAAPVLYAAWAEAGICTREDVMSLRKLSSDFEGHPTPRLPWVDVATGSLGQGLCAGVGIALNARRIGSDYRTYVLLGDGETAEGSVWEASEMGAFYNVDSLCGIIDVNAIGQSRPTALQHDLDVYAARWRAFGWHAIVVDGHDVAAMLDALAEARRTRGRPTMILARTIKGKGVSTFEGKGGWHGKPLKAGEEVETALAELKSQFVPEDEPAPTPEPPKKVQRAGARSRHTRHVAVQAWRQGGDARGLWRRAGAAGRRRRPDRGARRRRQELDVQREVRAAASRSLLPGVHRRTDDGWRRDGAGGQRARFRFPRRSRRS